MTFIVFTPCVTIVTSLCDAAYFYSRDERQVDESVVPSVGFQKAFEHVTRGYFMGTLASHRVLINLFLSHIILLSEF